ncbi:GntR family transcriptional regulator [Plantibacter sp. YIM 135249]|jgi:DNA-binding GntR family transcriptional regulator|uniref:GntR family transcriptional regulator n=1 Tax=Plantibacter sp. YIM 135249 TaxID=3423918 RepID=UPI003D343C67
MTYPAGQTGTLSRRLLRDEIYDTLLEAILKGTLEPGEILHDEALITWLGASRTPVREALNRLAEDGVVELVPHKHTRVAPLDFRAINEALYVSGVLHEHAARSIVADMTDADLAELQKYSDAAEDALRREELGDLGPAIRDFYLVFERSTPNRVLVETVESLSLQLLRFLTPREGLTDTSEIVRQIVEINAAAHKRDAKLTGDLIHAVYEPTRQNFLTTYRDA